MLAKLKFLRGTAFDIFGYMPERKIERQLIEDYKNTIKELLEKLENNNYQLALEIASLPEYVRGFGHVKLTNIMNFRNKQQILLDKYHGQEKKLYKPVKIAI